VASLGTEALQLTIIISAIRDDCCQQPAGSDLLSDVFDTKGSKKLPFVCFSDQACGD